MKAVAYIRVSTKSQGESGLGLEAQQQYIEVAARQAGWEIVSTFVESGVSGTIPLEDRPEGQKAIAACAEHGAVLVVAKLDRISRDVEHIARLMKTVPFKVATMPNADAFQLHLFAALAEQERAFIAQRTKDALASLQARANSGDADAQAKIERRNAALATGRTEANRNKALNAINQRVEGFNESVKHHMQACLFQGCKTFQQVADCLNGRGVVTSRGGQWKPMQVSRVMKSLDLSF